MSKHNKPKQSRRVGRVNESNGKASGVPNSIRVKLHYADYFTISPATIYSNYVYRGNSLFDPDYTSTGHQPRYFDTWATLYSKYKVSKSTINITFSSLNAWDSTIATVVPYTEVLAPTSFDQPAELPFARRTGLLPVSTQQGMKSSIVSSCSTTQILGLTPQQLQDEDYSAAVSANPNSIWYWNISAFSSTHNVAITVVVNLTYHAVFYDRLDPGLSLFVVKNPELNHKKVPRSAGLNQQRLDVSHESDSDNTISSISL
jgi:hypothetical protein